MGRRKGAALDYGRSYPAARSHSLVHGRLRGHVRLHGDGLDAGVLKLLERRLSLVLAAGRVVVDGDVGAALGEVLGDEGAEVLRVSAMATAVRQ